MSTIYMWFSDDSKYGDSGAAAYWNDVETHGGYDDAVASGPFVSALAALEDAAQTFNCRKEQIEVIFSKDQRCAS